jgi:hypothetical protein
MIDSERAGKDVTGFQDRLFQPLTHPSADESGALSSLYDGPALAFRHQRLHTAAQMPTPDRSHRSDMRPVPSSNPTMLGTQPYPAKSLNRFKVHNRLW